MAKTKNEMPSDNLSPIKLNVANLSKGRASQILARLREEGKSIQIDLYPALNTALQQAGEGSYFAGLVMSEVQKDAVPSTLNEGEFSDTILLKNLEGEKEMVVFYAGNKGIKAKLASLRPKQAVLVYYRGTKAAKTKGFNEWHDYGMEAFPNAADILEVTEALKLKA